MLIDSKIEIEKIYKEILWCRQFNSIIQGIDESNDNHKIIDWALNVRDCCLFKIWNTFYDLYCGQREICSLKKVVESIKNKEILYYDNGLSKDWIRKNDILNEINLISLDVQKVASSVKHIYFEHEQIIRKNESHLVTYNKNKKWFDDLIDKTETIIRKIKILNGETKICVCFSYDNKMYIDKISEVFRATTECAKNTENSIKNKRVSYWKVKAIEEK